MRRPPSILARTMLLHLAAFAGVFITIVVATYLLLTSTVNRFEQNVLEGHAREILQYLHHGEDGWQLSLPADLALTYRRTLGSFSLEVLTDDGKTLFSSFPQDHGRDQRTDLRAGFSQRKLESSAFYWFTLPKRDGGHTAWIQVGQNLASPDVIVDDILAQFVRRIAWIILPILGAIFAIDAVFLRRQFRPVIVASRAAAAIGPGSVQGRLPIEGLPREVLPLADAVNQALERLDRALRAQREFTADAAHELRTPLAILRTEIDMSLDGEAAARLQGDIDAMTHILDQLLELAELEGEGFEDFGAIDLAALAADVVGQIAPLALARGRFVEVDAPQPVIVRGSYQMLFRALRNLVENAIRHAPRTGHVLVAVRAPGTLSVKDDGPGIPLSERELAFQRFWRRKRDTRGNAGLGLPIVAKIAQLHGGYADIADNAEGGGANVSIHLPQASQARDD